jgi:hypothetical protein
MLAPFSSPVLTPSPELVALVDAADRFRALAGVDDDDPAPACLVDLARLEHARAELVAAAIGFALRRTV